MMSSNADHYDHEESDDERMPAAADTGSSAQPVVTQKPAAPFVSRKRKQADPLPAANGKHSILSFFGKGNGVKKPVTNESSATVPPDTDGDVKRPRTDNVIAPTTTAPTETATHTQPSSSSSPAASLPSSVPASKPKKTAAQRASKVAPNKSPPTDSNGDDEKPADDDDRAAAAPKDDDDVVDDADVPPSALLSATLSAAVITSNTRFGCADYDPIKDATWKAGERVPYSAMSAMFEAVEAESSRLSIIAIVSDFIRSVIALSPDDLLAVVYLAFNKIAPQYEGIELGIGDSILMKAIEGATGTPLAKIKEQVNISGDLGNTAVSKRTTQGTLFAPQPLTVTGVFQTFRQLAHLSGKSVQGRKAELIKKLMVSSKNKEIKYLIRALQGNLRIGLAEKGVLSALGRALVLTPPITKNNKTDTTDDKAKPKAVVADARKKKSETQLTALLERTHHLLTQAYTEVPSMDRVITSLMEYGVEALPEHCYLTPGIPVKVMLGKPTTSIHEVLERFKDQLFTLEYKYDGERAQIHLCSDGSIKIYSRNSENHTGKYPDIIAALPQTYNSGKHKKNNTNDVDNTENGVSMVSDTKPVVTNFIIDCECVAYDTVQQKILPFQVLSHRKRKDVSSESVTVNVVLFAFDLLYLNDRSYLNEPLQVRRQALWDHFTPIDAHFYFAVHRDSDDLEEIQTFLDEAVQNSCEGLMVKALTVDATYIPAKRNWLKVKKDYMDTVGDTVDLVPIGAWYGRGKRTGTYGSFLLACYDDENEEYQSCTKIGTGFSDEALLEFANFYNRTELANTADGDPVPPANDNAAEDEHNGSTCRLLTKCPKYYRVSDSMIPDVWLAPVAVWEVKCADLSISPIHYAAVGRQHESKGIALRFPRFIRRRMDKRPDEATTSEQISQMYANQAVISGNKSAANRMDEDDD